MLTKQEIIEKYGVSNQTIKRRTKEGLLHPIKQGNKNYYDENEVDKVFNVLSNHDQFVQLINEFYGYEPYTFLEKYKDNSTNIKLICNTCKNEVSISPGNIKNNMRNNKPPMCKYCAAKKMSESKIKNEEDYINELKTKFNNEYTLLGEYKGNDVKTLHKCNICNYEWEVTPGNLYNSLRINKHCCPSCNNMTRDNRPYSERLKEVTDVIIPLEEYKGRKVEILHKCLVCNHEWKSTPDNRLRGEGCPKCANKINQSKAELELIEYIKSLKDDIIIETKNRNILNGKEIDVLIPEYTTGFEMNGNYWHSEKYKGKKYHKEKTDLAETKNIRLIQILDDEWYEKQDIVKSKIKHILKINDLEKIYARKCTIREITTKEKNDFLNKNHIQGEDRSNIKLGLFYNEILVSVMTFAKPRISMGKGGNKIKYDYELSRFSSNIDYIVVGAFSKLFKYFERNYDWTNIISYADRRWSQGNVYEKNGWNKEHVTSANYWYVNKNTKKRYHRYTFRKQCIKEKFPNIYDDKKTEFEMMDMTEYFRIWDCGNIAYSYIKK